ncbi:hypothetical protein LX36DRAFT_700087 [Colletotrichum falcatum]|nr:hypothetical protein LX36DRAFT_700087 [Colletotrichum falcatum]
MRGVKTSVLVLSGLTALTKAREIKVDEVPVECATICGPIVELTYKCDVDGSFDELRRRNLDGPPPSPPAPEKGQARKRDPGGGGHGVVRRHHRRPAQDAVAGGGGGDESTSAQKRKAVPTQLVAAQPAAVDSTPVFIATLPLVAPDPDPVTSTSDAQNAPTPSAEPPQTSDPPPPHINILDEHLDYQHFDKYIHVDLYDNDLQDDELFNEEYFHNELHNEIYDIKYPKNQYPPATSATSTTSGNLVFLTSVGPPDRIPDDAAAADGAAAAAATDTTATAAATAPAAADGAAGSGAHTDPGSATGTVYSRHIRSATANTTASAAAVVNIATATTAPWAPYAASTNLVVVVVVVSIAALIHSTYNPPPRPSSNDPVPQPIAGGGGPQKQPSQEEVRENAERDCTCKNKSFDVQLLSGLCQSCIRKSGNWAINLDIIMAQCNFTGADYTPSKDRLVDSIRVEAQKPFLSSSGNVLAGAGRFRPGSAAAAAAAVVSLVAGMALFL